MKPEKTIIPALVLALVLLAFAACSGKTEPPALQADIKTETPIVFSHNSVTLADGSPVYVNIEMVSGQYAFDEIPGAFQGSSWSGQYQIRVYTDEANVKNPVYLAPISIEENQSMSFKGEFPLVFDDYNNDGNPDFTLGQYASSNGYVYAVLTVTQAGEVEKLDTGGLMFISESDYSVRLEKLSPTSFTKSGYDNTIGETVKSIYQWKDNRFMPED
jgi:hypothetical protein